ncbi:MAG: hypothetical protein AMJ90_00325 [candidate division Zixibacteria bacterium SM23_73_2]|nr:MAG: hypothetical protein AMJ90_00325 [candidate division Zixibacteria bacterium SM23_73_2]
MSKEYYLGIDIGSVSVKVVLLDKEERIVYHSYKRFEGQPLLVLKQELAKLFENISTEKIVSTGITGSGAKKANELLDSFFVNEIIAQIQAAKLLCPHARTIIEMGGQDSKLILLEHQKISGNSILKDFSMNTLCAAGTGSFLDQQAKRLIIKIEDEFGELALKSKNPPRIAGRCSVFAKSDMIHLQQIGTPDYDIVAGLCYAMARNFKSNIARGKKIDVPVCFFGGVASNLGIRKAFVDVFELEEKEFVVSEYHKVSGAIGAALKIKEQGEKRSFSGLDKLGLHLDAKDIQRKSKEKLSYKYPESKYYNFSLDFDLKSQKNVDAYLGIDVGSLSTNVVVIDKNKKLLAKSYLMTEGRPLDAVKKGLDEVYQKVKDKVNILGVGTTGSGRYLVGDFVGADVIHNEITCQAKAAVEIDPKVDTIFEIGGQDSKFISLEHGRVVDFEMNKVCAAGTGSFLQEQAERLNIEIEKFGDLALEAEFPVNCGERCTVFMESDLVSHQHQGASKKDLVAGLCYSIAYNYLNKVVGDKKIKENIFFQGGVAWNKGVVSAFEKILDKKITVPPHQDVTGAIGSAILALENYAGVKTSFRGFDLSKTRYSLSTFECRDCPNHCEIKKIEIEGKPPLYYGSRCEKYEVVKKRKEKKEFENLFSYREKILKTISKKFIHYQGETKKGKIGIPRALFFLEFLPFWITFFENLGFEVVVSDKTNKNIVHTGCEKVSADVCFPIKVAFGHINNLFSKEVDFIFLPSLINMKKDQNFSKENYACPYVQAIPYMVGANFNFDQEKSRLLTLPLHFQRGEKHLLKELLPLKKILGIKRERIEKSLDLAEKCQSKFYATLQKKGQEVLSQLKGKKALVIVGRPYNTCDPQLSLDLPKKLLDLGALAIPLDFLPQKPLGGEVKRINMYWKYGQNILSASCTIREHKNLYPVYVTNFGCGPDSFIFHFFRKNVGSKPLLQLELDEHSADAGIITRCEAFLDSLKNFKEKEREVSSYVFVPDKNQKIIYIPNMTDHAYALKASLCAFGLKAVVLPESDQETLVLGRKYTSGKECYPCILTTGDFVKLLKSDNFDPENSAFFMPTANGPCRFGQYQNLQRIVLDQLGYHNIPIYSPDSKDSYSNVLNLDGKFRRTTWQGMVAIDLLQKLLWQTRPYEENPGETDGAYQEFLKRVEKSLAENQDIKETLYQAKEAFKNIKKKKSQKRPRIGVVGEIYIRSNRFANNDLVRKIENLGGEAKVAPMAEWIFYTTHRYKEDSLIDKRYMDFLKGSLKDRIQRKDEKQLIRIFESDFYDLHDFSIKKVLGLSCLYLHNSFGTEAVLSVGKGIEYIAKDYSGIVNTMPFTCMPGNIVTALSSKMREDFGNIPWLNIAYEGLEDTFELTRLEAFMHQAKEFKKKHES